MQRIPSVHCMIAVATRATGTPSRAATSPPHYAVTQYALPPGTGSQYPATGINASGTVATTVVTGDGRTIAATLSPTRLAPSGFNSYPTAINVRGTVVGEYRPTDASYSFPALFRNGRAVLLQGGNFGYATGVNDADVVVGDELGAVDTPVVWLPGSIVPTPITATLPPGAILNRTVGINDTNVVVANVIYPLGPVGLGAVILNGGTWKPLQIAGLPVTATALNNASVVVGFAGDRHTNAQAFVWDGTSHLLPRLPGTSACEADYVNNGGDVSGYCLGATFPQLNRPFLWHAGTLYALFSLIASGPVPKSGIDGGINDAGQIVVYDDYFNRLYLFTPTTATPPGAVLHR